MGGRAQLASSSVRGKAAEFLFMQQALESGWEVAVPVAEDSVWDVLIHRGQGWERVQVKRAYPRRGYPTVEVTRADGKRYVKFDADWLAAVDVPGGRVWLIPFEEVAGFTRKQIMADLEHYRMLVAPAVTGEETT